MKIISQVNVEQYKFMKGFLVETNIYCTLKPNSYFGLLIYVEICNVFYKMQHDSLHIYLAVGMDNVLYN